MHKQCGVSLAEVMVTLSILAVLAAVSAGNLGDLLKRQQANGEAERLFSALQVARSEAVKRGRVVSICGSGDGVSCDGNWATGWLLFVDNDRNGQLGNGEELLRQGSAGHGFELSYSAFGSTRYLRYSPLGITYEQNGTFKLCPEDDDARFARALIVSKTARVRFAPDRDNDGVREDASGRALGCD